MIYFLNYKNKKKNFNNTGDNFCSPCQYFQFPFEYTHEDLLNYKPSSKDIVILGGGGIFDDWHNENYVKFLDVCEGKVIWGAGVNNHGSSSFDPPMFVKNWDIRGFRDRKPENIFDWVPCPSCMSVLFDNDYKITNNTIIYEHAHEPIKLNYPRTNNIGDCLEEKISFIASANNIITNTYHGAYWALLLGKSVMMYEPFSNRHLLTPWRLPLIDRDWNHKTCGVKEPTLLNSCREISISFYDRVCEFIYSKNTLD